MSSTSSSDLDSSKVDFYIGENGELDKSRDSANQMIQVRQSYAEEDEDMYEVFHQAIAEENDEMEVEEAVQLTPPPLPPKLLNKKNASVSSGSLSDIRIESSSTDSACGGQRRRSLTLNVLISK
jgi:hypothetical protein